MVPPEGVRLNVGAALERSASMDGSIEMRRTAGLVDGVGVVGNGSG